MPIGSRMAFEPRPNPDSGNQPTSIWPVCTAVVTSTATAESTPPPGLAARPFDAIQQN
jgi:hypothetical protein